MQQEPLIEIDYRTKEEEKYHSILIIGNMNIYFLNLNLEKLED